MNKKLISKTRKIKIFLMDVDGVLTDGKMYFFQDSRGKTQEIKAFNALDGIGLILLDKFGIMTGVITGREAKGAEQRARMLHMNYAYQGFLSKIAPLEEILKDSGLKDENVAYMGDDLTDIPVLKRVGLACAPANSVEEVKKNADIVTKNAGGDGAAREICDLILEARGFKAGVMAGVEKALWPAVKNKKIKTVLYSKWKPDKERLKA
ncbi:MAG: hypothetical protein COT17_00250 [Elusimicrobia bacterium CG08_land_8_20_14_0_20_51_18]|nr:MAG: hypothetical protein COT17_00250 [Elusimicrobia bacterium CG08_land_8_20_14_0_20_51_18]